MAVASSRAATSVAGKLTRQELDEYKRRLAATMDAREKALILRELSERIEKSRLSAA